MESLDQYLSSRNHSINYLKLTGRAIQEIPESISRFSFLDTLNLAYNEITSLPSGLFTLHNLQRLLLGHNQLTDLPPAIHRLRSLKELSIHHNPMTHIPSVLFELDQLERLTVSPFIFKELKEIFPILNLEDPYTFEHESIPTFLNQIIRLEQYFEINPTNLSTKRIFWNLTLGNLDRVHQIAELEDLLVCLSSQLPFIEEATEKLLVKRFESHAQLPAKGSQIYWLGEGAIDFHQWENELAILGWKFVENCSKKISYFVFGEEATLDPNWEKCVHQAEIIIPAANLTSILESQIDPYLEREADPEMIDNIARLLYSENQDSIELGLELIKQGGIPSETITDLFIAADHLIDKNNKLRNRIIKLLSKMVSNDLASLLKRRKFGFEHMDERKVSYHLMSLKKFKELKLQRIAKYLYDKKRLGEAYLLQYGHPSLRLMVLRARLDGDYLNLSHLGLEKLPREIGQMKQLRSITLSDNCFTEVPPILFQLKKLEQLNLSNNHFKEFPFSLSKFRYLKRLHFVPNPNYFEAELPTKEALKGRLNRKCVCHFVSDF